MRIFILFITTLLAACGSQPIKPQSNHESLAAALASGSQSAINQRRDQRAIRPKNNHIINLYLLALDDQPHQIVNQSRTLVNHWDHHSPAQRAILKPLLLWAYAHPIYRQETAKQVRILQRETLMLAPSHIDFARCETQTRGCSHQLRSQISPKIFSPNRLTETLIQMANNDPCINLSDQNVGGDVARNCLANRKGNLKINLLSPPRFLKKHWLAMLNPTMP